MVDGNQLRELRKKNKLTASELAKKLHVSRATVYRWELDNSLRDNDLINALADLYGMSAEQLYRESPTCETAVAEEPEQDDIAPVGKTAGTEEKAAKKQLSLVKIGAITAASTFTLFAIVTAIIILCVYFQPNTFDGENFNVITNSLEMVVIICIMLASVILATTATVLSFYFIRKRRK